MSEERHAIRDPEASSNTAATATGAMFISTATKSQ
jgi:hypothetical protein